MPKAIRCLAVNTGYSYNDEIFLDLGGKSLYFPRVRDDS